MTALLGGLCLPGAVVAPLTGAVVSDAGEGTPGRGQRAGTLDPGSPQPHDTAPTPPSPRHRLVGLGRSRVGRLLGRPRPRSATVGPEDSPTRSAAVTAGDQRGDR